MKSLLICLEGLDQAGKNSTSITISNKLRRKGYKTEVISFPDYSTEIGKIIRKFLQGEISFTPDVRQFLYVANRLERLPDIKQWLNDDKIVIADRYTPSGLVYGYVNELDLNWMINLEKDIPKANITIVIDVPAKTAYNRVEEKDLYESDIDFQTRVRSTYLELAKKFEWTVIKGERPLEEIAEDVLKEIYNYFK